MGLFNLFFFCLEVLLSHFGSGAIAVDSRVKIDVELVDL
jgi:hypothetical protein